MGDTVYREREREESSGLWGLKGNPKQFPVQMQTDSRCLPEREDIDRLGASQDIVTRLASLPLQLCKSDLNAYFLIAHGLAENMITNQYLYLIFCFQVCIIPTSPRILSIFVYSTYPFGNRIWLLCYEVVLNFPAMQWGLGP